MYKIEKFLLEHGFKKIKEYASDVRLYSDAEQEWEYEIEVAIFANRKIWEISVHNPYAIILQGYKDYKEDDYRETQKLLAEDITWYSFKFKKWLEEQVKDPWEDIN